MIDNSLRLSKKLKSDRICRLVVIEVIYTAFGLFITFDGNSAFLVRLNNLNKIERKEA